MRAWPNKRHSAGFYVNIIFEGQPAIIDQLRTPFHHEPGRLPGPVHHRPGAQTGHSRRVTGRPMANFNKVILAGNLTRDPELRYTPKGTAIAKLGLAINRTWRTETGETQGRGHLRRR